MGRGIRKRIIYKFLLFLSLQIADFGLANNFKQDSLLRTFCGSPLYASPEIVTGVPYVGPEVSAYIHWWFYYFWLDPKITYQVIYVVKYTITCLLRLKFKNAISSLVEISKYRVFADFNLINYATSPHANVCHQSQTFGFMYLMTSQCIYLQFIWIKSDATIVWQSLVKEKIAYNARLCLPKYWRPPLKRSWVT